MLRLSLLRGLSRSVHTSCAARRQHRPHLEVAFPERRATFETCGELYSSWRAEGRRAVPPGPLACRDVRYVDTAPHDVTAPTVVLLHGSPGTYTDFASQINFLHGQGARVVAANFPDYSVFPAHVFKHTSLEKYHYIKDFLKTIDLQRIDMLVGHSSAAYTALHLYLQTNLEIGSLAFLNPGCHQRIKAMNPPWAYNFIFKMVSEKPWGIQALRISFKLIMAFLRPPLRYDFEAVVLAGEAQTLSGWERAAEDYAKVKELQVPTLLAFSDNDVLMNKEATYALLDEVLSIPTSDIWKYDHNGELIQTGSDSSWARVMGFAKGSHYVFWKYPDLINQALLDLMARSRRQQSAAAAKQRVVSQN